MTLYGIKPRFLDLLRPAARALARAGVTANQVTLAAAAGSLAFGGALLLLPGARWLYLALPPWLLVRMALNALDGMLAREFGQKSPLGAYLNEICDVVSDAALYLPFAFLSPFTAPWMGLVLLLLALSEFAGVLGPMIGAARRYDGPLGKSDRALVFGALAAWVGLGGPLPAWAFWLQPALAAALGLTTVNRIRAGIRQAREARPAA